MQYSFLTQDQKDDIVAGAMMGREVEHFHHDHNTKVYTEMLATLPQDAWPANLVQFKDLSRDQVVAAAGADADQVLTYQYRDQLQHLLKTETVERDRVDRVHQGLVAQFGGDSARQTAAVDRVKVAAAAAK